MGQLGRYLQKCMYPVGLRPFLELSIANLLASEHCDAQRDRLTLVVGHHREQIEAYFGDDYHGLRVQYLPQGEPLGTGHALYQAYQGLEPTSSVIVWLADLYVPITLFSRMQHHPAENVLTVAPGHEEESDKLRISTKGERVTRAWNGEGERFDIGFWKLSSQVLANMTRVKAENGEYRALPNLQRCIDEGVQVGYLEADAWLHLGGVNPTPEANVRTVVEQLFALEEPA